MTVIPECRDLDKIKLKRSGVVTNPMMVIRTVFF